MASNVFPHYGGLKLRFTKSDGTPLAGGKVYTYIAGSSSAKATYSESTGTTANANPIILDSRGEATCFLNGDAAYKFVVYDADDVEVYTVDNVRPGIDFAEGSFTATLTGCTTSPTGTVYYVRQGKQVTLNVPAISGTSNTTAATLTGLPATLYPARAETVLARITDNGTTTVGLAVIGTDGTITLYASAAAAAFTNSGTKGVAAVSLTYSLR